MFKSTLFSTLGILVLGAAMLCPNSMLAHGEDPGPVNLPSISEKTEGMDHLEGYFNLHWDR